MKKEIETKDGYIIRGDNICEKPLKGTHVVRMSNGKEVEGRLLKSKPLL